MDLGALEMAQPRAMVAELDVARARDRMSGAAGLILSERTYARIVREFGADAPAVERYGYLAGLKLTWNEHVLESRAIVVDREGPISAVGSVSTGTGRRITPSLSSMARRMLEVSA